MTVPGNETPETRLQVGEAPQTIRPDQVKDIADQVHGLIRTGDEGSAWELIRHLHPADIGSVLVALPRNSRDTVLRVMSPDTATWILRQMNPV